jgi:hypothetical protein
MMIGGVRANPAKGKDVGQSHGIGSAGTAIPEPIPDTDTRKIST